MQDPLSFHVSSGVRWTNGLWFTSLTLSLVVSLLAILAKQWLSEFQSRMRAPASSPKMWALRHNAYKGGLDRWGMSAFISAIPLILHAALFLFLVGLCLLLQPLDVLIAGLVVAITGLICFFYLAAGLAPLFWGTCPSATPGLRHLWTFWYEFIVIAGIQMFKILAIPITTVPTVLLRGFALCCLIALIPVRIMFVVVPIWLGVDRRWAGMYGGAVEWATHGLNQIRAWFSSITHAIAQYHYKSPGSPAFDQATILATDIPLREASALSWMIRTLPAEDDIAVALCAVGFLSAGDHHAYFNSGNQTSPLVHNDVQKAVEDTLESIAARPGGTDDLTVASLLHACISVSLRSPKLSVRAKQFLSTFADVEAHNSGQFSTLICSNSVTAVQDICPDPQWSIVRLAIIACEMCKPQDQTAIASAVRSHLQENEARRQDGNHIDDPWLNKLIRLDSRFFNSSRLNPLFYLVPGSISNYSAAANQVQINCATGLSRELQNRLRFLTTPTFLASNFSAGDLNNIAAVLLLANPEGLSCIRPVLLRHLLYHFEYRGLPVLPETILWIQAAFHISRVHIHRLLVSWKYLPADLIIPGSHLSLLRPITLHMPRPGRAGGFLQDISKYSTSIQSPWGQMLSVILISSTAQVVSEMACMYSILLLAMHRRGFHQLAQAMLRELLPHRHGYTMIAHGTRSRQHLALHARVIDVQLWEELSGRLLQSIETATWTACEKYPDAGAFFDAISGQTDCQECPHDESEIAPSWAALLKSTYEPQSDEVEQDAGSPVGTATAETQFEPTRSPHVLAEHMRHVFGSPCMAPTDKDDQLEMGQRA